MKKSFFYAGALILALGIGYYGTKTVKASNMGPYTGSYLETVISKIPIKYKKYGVLEYSLEGKDVITGCDCTRSGKKCYCRLEINN